MKILLALIFNLSMFNAFAQFGAQGQKVLGGTLNFNAGNATNSLSPEAKSNFNNAGGSVNIGKFTKINTLRTFSVSYVHGYVKNQATNNSARNNSNSVFLSYGITKYKEVAKKLFLGIGGAAYTGYGRVKNYSLTLPDRSESDGFSFGAYFFPVGSYQVSERWVVNVTGSSQFLNVGYGISTAKSYSPNQPTTKSQTQNFSLQAGLFGSELKNITFGFSYLLKNKRKS